MEAMPCFGGLVCLRSLILVLAGLSGRAVYGVSLGVVSNLPASMDVSCECYVLSGKCLYVGLITSPGVS